MGKTPVIWWVRRDFRLNDNPSLTAALKDGAPVVPVFICDPIVEALGAAPKWRLGLGVEAFADTLKHIGSRLILRQGDALSVLRELCAEMGAREVHWTRQYDPDQIARDKHIKASLTRDGVAAASHGGHLLFEPWTVQTGAGAFYKVYTPFWKSVRDRDPGLPETAPTAIAAPENWPESDNISDWKLGAAMNRGRSVVCPYLTIGEQAAKDRLTSFIEARVSDYDRQRDIPGIEGTSGLSENLTYGEIGPRTVWAAGQNALAEGMPGAETFLKELVWREFSYHLLFHTPHIASGNWRSEWDTFPWNEDGPHAEAWKQGRTGIRFVDAAMREMYVTGRMHNRGRMIVASYLTKHLMTHWKVGLKWFEDCLVDWDPAANAMGWQWAAGSGPDAAPYFRVFNPDTQLDKFDRDGAYQRAWLAELYPDPSETALSYFEAIPRTWSLSPTADYPEPVVQLDEGRKRALDAYQAQRAAA